MGLNLLIKLFFIILLCLTLIACTKKNESAKDEIIEHDINIVYDSVNFKLESYVGNEKQFDVTASRLKDYNSKREIENLNYMTYKSGKVKEFYTIDKINEDKTIGNVTFEGVRLNQENRRVAAKDLLYVKDSNNFVSPYILILENKLLMFGKKFTYNVLNKNISFDDDINATIEDNANVKFNEKLTKDIKSGLL